MHRALYQEPAGNKVRCMLCPQVCLLGEGQTGDCGVRVVESGTLYTMNYGCLAAANVDPIEKKPLYHFYPGHSILSLGTIGCNLHCSFCQNWALARGDNHLCREEISPESVLAMLESRREDNQLAGVAYTYNEPLIWYEFVLRTAELLHKHGYRNVLVTNGFINLDPLMEMLPYIDAMNIDVKGFTDQFYREYCRGRKKPVLRTVEKAVESCHVEITCLLIPSLNDSPAEQQELASWLGSLSPDLVLHYSRYFPNYRMELPPTPESTLKRTLEIARKHLHYVYPGNIDLPGGADTICPNCSNLLVSRSGYRVRMVGLDGNRCNNCNSEISIVVS